MPLVLQNPNQPLLSDPTVIFQTTENGTPTLGLTSNELIRKMVQKEFYKFCEQFIEAHLLRQDRMNRSEIENLEYHYWRVLMDLLRYQQRRAIQEYRQTILKECSPQSCLFRGRSRAIKPLGLGSSLILYVFFHRTLIKKVLIPFIRK